MKLSKLKTSIEEAERFIKLAKEAVKEIYEYHKARPDLPNGMWEYTPSPSRKASATKRASLDLSVVLSDLRKPRWLSITQN